MKKLLLLLLTIMTFGFWAAPLSAQETLTVYDGTATNGYVPVYGFYADAYLKAEFVVPSEELTEMSGGEITSLKFYATQSSVSWGSASFKVFLTEVDATTLSAFTNLNNATVVYEGPLSISNNEMVVTLSTSYIYNGGNLLIGVYNTASGSYVTSTWNGENVTGASIQGYSYSDLSSVSPTQRNFIPKTTFTYIPGDISCHPISDLAVSEVGPSTAHISWVASEDASSYILQYKTPSQNWNSEAVNTVYPTGDFYDLDGLTPATSYNVRVASYCGVGDTSYWRSTNFMSGCDAITITEDEPWTEDFEGYTGTSLICWETPVTYVDGSNTFPNVLLGYGQAAHSGSNSAEFKGNSNLLVFPEFSNDIHELRMSFWATQYGSSTSAVVGVITDITDPSTFETLGNAGTPGSRGSSSGGNGAYMGPFDFNSIEASSGRIAILFTGNGSSNGWNLDDFTVELSPDCPSPVKTSVTASNIDGHNATISWVDNDETHNSWTVYYKQNSEDADAWQPETVNYETTLTLTDLVPETTYNVYVVTNCGGIPSEDATLTTNFTTDVACPVPTAVTANPVYINDATITWTSSAPAFNVEYGETGFTQGSGNMEVAYENSILLEDLEPATSYTVYVQADCGSGEGTSATWASVQFTTLPSCPKPTNVHSTSTTTTTVDLEWTAGYEETEWEIVYGPKDFNPDTSTVSVSVTGTPAYQLESLNPDTRYDVYVRALCSGIDPSEWSSLYYFKTPCEPAQLPLTENFDEYDVWYSPDCWRKFETPSMSGYAYIQGSEVYSGNRSLIIGTNYSSNTHGLIRLPDLDTEGISELQVKFMAKKSSGDRPLIVGITPDFNSVDSLYIVAALTDLTSGYAEKIVSLESYPGTTGYIVIGIPDGTGYCIYYIDDVTVETRPNCMYPTDFAATDVGETFVTLSWTELGTAESWTIEYGPINYTPGNGTPVTATDSTVFTVEDLEESTAYDFYVQADCGSISSQWVGPVRVVTSQYLFGITGSDTITTCGMALYDNGGPNSDYGTSCNYTLVVNPATEGSGLSITGTVNTYNSSAYYAGVVTIYAGVGTSGEVLGTYSGNKTVNLAYAGPVTINFTSGSYYSGAGFELIVQCTDCFPPTAVTISEPTMTGATVSWSGNAGEYAVYAMSASDTVEATTSETTYTFDELTPATNYKVYVKSLCGDESSLPSSIVSFNTACDVIPIPWFEDFENYSSSSFVCWERPITYQANNGTFPLVYRGYAQSCHSGENSAELKGPELMLVLPEFDQNIQDLRLSFWATKTDGAAGTMQIGVISDIMDPTTFQVVIPNAGTPGPRGGQEGVSGNGNLMGPFDLNGSPVSTGRIALRYTDPNASTTPGQTAASWNLDDFTVELSPDCPSPAKTSVTATYIDGHNATITFIDNDENHDSWIVYYRETNAADDDPWLSEEASSTSVVLSNLDPETYYDVYVITNCGTVEENPDATLTYTFQTTIACPAPSNVTVSNVTATSATLAWNSMAESWQICLNGDEENLIDVDVTSYDLTDLTPETIYTVKVRSICGADGQSAWSNTISFEPTAKTVIGSGTATNSFLPTYSYYNYSLTQQIYTVEEIGENTGAILSIDYYCSGSITRDVNIYMVSTDKTGFTSATDWIPVTDNNLVYSGTVAFEANAWTTITLDDPFVYNGENNVAIIFDDNTGSYVSSSPNFLVFDANNMAIRVYSDGTNYDPYDPSSYSGAVLNVKNQIRLAIGEVPACPRPADISVSNIGSNSADINWTPTGTETSWNLEYKKSSETTWEVISVSEHPYTLNNLDAATAYNVRVQANCSDGDVSDYRETNFLTACDVVSNFPYTESFENGLVCWESVDGTSSSYNWTITSSDSYLGSAPNGNQYVIAKLTAYTDATVRLLSPIFDLTSVENPYVSFAHIQYAWGDDQDEMSVYYRTSASDEWTMLAEYTNNISSWVYDSIALPSPSATYQISFVASNSWGHGIGVDEIKVFNNDGSGPATDPTVTTNSADPIGSTNATLHGTINNPSNVSVTPMGFEWKTASATDYTPVTVTGDELTYLLDGLSPNTNYSYRAFITYNGNVIHGNVVNFTTAQVQEPTATTLPADPVGQTTATLHGTISNPDGVTITVQGFQWKEASATSYTTEIASGTTMTATLDELTPNTDYIYRAFVTTANGQHFGEEVTFTTLEPVIEPCAVPTGLAASEITHNSFTVTWNAVPNASYTLRYRPAEGQWTSVTPSTNSHELTSLAAETTYEVQVQADCGGDNVSAWSESLNVTTLPDGIPTYLLNSVALYPNPAKEYVDIRVDNEVNVNLIEVYDVYGKLVNTVNVVENPTRINVSGLANGMYFVRVSTDAGTVTKSFVKK